MEWVDSTITGIGRGPGNTLTEELILEISQKNRKSDKNNLNLVPLIKIINNHFLPMKMNIHGELTSSTIYLENIQYIHPIFKQCLKTIDIKRRIY